MHCRDKKLRNKVTGEPFTENGPEKRAAVALKNGGKCLEAMVISLDGKDTTFHLVIVCDNLQFPVIR